MEHTSPPDSFSIACRGGFDGGGGWGGRSSGGGRSGDRVIVVGVEGVRAQERGAPAGDGDVLGRPIKLSASPALRRGLAGLDLIVHSFFRYLGLSAEAAKALVWLRASNDIIPEFIKQAHN